VNVVGLDGVPIGPQYMKADGKFFLGADGNGRDIMVGCSTAAAIRSSSG
jgi:hypothetical protein